MTKRLSLFLVLMVLLPLGLLVFLGYRVAQEEKVRSMRAFDHLLMQRLDDIDRTISKFISRKVAELKAILPASGSAPNQMTSIMQASPLAAQLFLLDPDGVLLYPDLNAELSLRERAFLARTKNIWVDRTLLRLANPQEATQSQNNYVTKIQASGWHTWFREAGLHLIYWQRNGDRHIIGTEVSRIRLLSELLAELPSTPTGSATADSRIVLSGASGKALYQWGGYHPPENTVPRVKRGLSSPLQSWTLACYVAPGSAASGGGGFIFNLIGGGIAVALALIVMAVVIHRENRRALKEAGERVSFVNQVSHELKTPLTNIRMYAELLESRIDEEDADARTHLSVVTSESQRLGRLIENVLAFARQQRGSLKLRMQKGKIDECISEVLQQFTPTLERLDIEVRTELHATEEVQFDSDAVMQILGNLINNVEKYAAKGKMLRIGSEQKEPDLTVITVSDQGPGIPKDKWEEVFTPFRRLSEKLTEGTSGTGIGLSIARELARLHGGDLCIVPTKKGAGFSLTIETVAAKMKNIETH